MDPNCINRTRYKSKLKWIWSENETDPVFYYLDIDPYPIGPLIESTRFKALNHLENPNPRISEPDKIWPKSRPNNRIYSSSNTVRRKVFAPNFDYNVFAQITEWWWEYYLFNLFILLIMFFIFSFLYYQKNVLLLKTMI